MICVNSPGYSCAIITGMLKTGMFLPGHCPQRDRRDRRQMLLLAGTFLGAGAVVTAALLVLALFA